MLVAGLDALRRALHLESWTLGGVSYATFTAEEYTLTYPDRVRRLVLDSVVTQELARLAGCSPQHLSRVFRRVTGRSLTFHRNELRVRAVLGRLEAGDLALRTLAAEYPFADQAHLTRVFHRHLRTTPAVLRTLLAATPPVPGPTHHAPLGPKKEMKPGFHVATT